jgi:hypothetical protein
MVNIVRKGKPHSKLFISHYHKEKELAGRIKGRLENRFNIDVFVAHDDINPTEEWQETILRELETSNVFIMLLSRDFKTSDWTDQETGIAIQLKQKIIPVALDIPPYGFAGKYQALKWKEDAFDWGMRELVMVLYGKHILDTNEIVSYFTCSDSFKEAKENFNILDWLKRNEHKFTDDQIWDIAHSIVLNPQLCYMVVDVMAILREYKHVIGDSDIVDVFKQNKWPYF